RKIRRRIYKVIAQVGDQPGKDPVVADHKPTGRRDCVRFGNGPRPGGVYQVVVVVAVQADRIEFELAAVLESHLATDSVEGVLDRADEREHSSAEILLVGAV